MKIGILRSGQSFDIDFYSGSANALGTDLRVPIMEALVQLGHELTVLGVIPKKQQWLLDGKVQHPYYDYSWLQQVNYEPENVPSLDILLVECSTTNAFYGEVNLKRLIQVLAATHDTKCVVYQHGDASREISVPLGDIYSPEEKKSLIAQWARAVDVQMNGNRWLLWTHAYQPELVRQSDSNRTAYRLHCERALQIPLGYSPNFDRPLVDYPVRDIDLVYVGRQKTPQRTARLVELAGNGCCIKELYGKWDNPPEDWKYGGFIAGHGRVYELLPKAKASLCVGDPWFYKTGTLTTRIVQTIRSGAALFMDSKWEEAGLEITHALVDNHEQLHRNLFRWQEINEAQRKKLRLWADILPEVLIETIGVT